MNAQETTRGSDALRAWREASMSWKCARLGISVAKFCQVYPQHAPAVAAALARLDPADKRLIRRERPESDVWPTLVQALRRFERELELGDCPEAGGAGS
jgi:hypothetical protein